MGEKSVRVKRNYKQTLLTGEQTLRNYQDTIFSCLYSDPERVLDLYFTLHPEDRDSGITSDQVELITLENVFLATLGSYYNFIHFVRDNIVNGRISIKAVEYYVNHFVGVELFKEFLEKLNAEEVTKMANYEFDLDEAKEVWREEAMEEGLENGIRNLMDTMKLNLNQAMDALKIPAEERPMYAARIRKQ